MSLMSRKRRDNSAIRVADRALRDATRSARWAARTAWVLLRLSPERVATTRLVVRLWWRDRRQRGGDRLEVLRLRDDDAVLELWVSEFSDLHVAREAFGDKQYALPEGFQPRTILDLGANIGASVLWFHRRYPDAEIHAVEPDGRALRKLRRNVRGLPGVTVHPVALAGEDGRRTFYEAEQTWSSSLMAEAAHGGRPATVAALTLEALMRDRVGRQRVDLLKLDVEGAEWEVLPKQRLAELANAVAGELHAGLLGDEGVERDAWRHGLEDFEVRFARHEGSGHFVALPRHRVRPTESQSQAAG
jgi:FkbM family methyltransferase